MLEITLGETIRLMQEIGEAIEQYAGGRFNDIWILVSTAGLMKQDQLT